VRTSGVFERVVRYAASEVMMLLDPGLGKDALAVTGVLVPFVAGLECSPVKNGSLISSEGDMTRVGRVGGPELAPELALDKRGGGFRVDLLPEGDANRERVLRKLDLRFVGGGRVVGSMGS
jgi:hypothetical protein